MTDCQWCENPNDGIAYPHYHYKQKRTWLLQCCLICRNCWDSLTVLQQVLGNNIIGREGALSQRKINNTYKQHKKAIEAGQKELF